MDKQTFTLLVKKLEDTDSDIMELRKDIHYLRQDISSLKAFKWRLYGMAGALSCILSFVISYFSKG